MPRNRYPIDRAEKRDEILAAARGLFARVGFAGTTMGKVAERAGVTTNTIYWYFSDKDSLLVAVLDQVNDATLDHFRSMQLPSLVDRILWVVAGLERYRRLVEAVHSRLEVSSRISEWHDGFHSTWEGLLAKLLREEGLPIDEVPTMTRIIVMVIEGMLTHQHDSSDRRAILVLLLRPLG
ncbi:TetR/AcrR family transcriptional regulator [Corynebacterium sp.]|uniref:TetR/AcrR family transcriptional regulator n=1 Tax=Corynebacterium sp. TaxID=1720 RepID=UPI0025BBF609|nr:TetR/AcrR family transcriptional regulator [Corynebacterium sp.]